MSKSRKSARLGAQQKASRSDSRLKYLLGIGLVLAIGAAALLVFQPGSPTKEEPSTAVGTGSNLIEPDSYKLGPSDAPVTLVEFLDPECESCRAMYPTVERVLATYGDDVQFVVRYFPLHANSVLAAKALEAAGLQGKYWDFMDILFEKQPEWGEKKQPQTALMLGYARSLGLDMGKFEQDMARADFDQKILRDKAAGAALGVEGTPTFFLNGTVVGSGMTYGQLSSKIDALLR